MNVFLSSIGCRLNEAELQMWVTAFVKYGYHIVLRPQFADIIVLNSCTVTAEAARKSRKSIRRFKNQNAHAKLVVTGCYSSMEKQGVLDQLDVDLVVPNLSKDHLAQTVHHTFSPDINCHNHAPPPQGLSNLLHRGMQRAFIKIQDGCRYRCTFCMVTLARGEERSRSSQDILQEISLLCEEGVNEVVLTGVHLGGYGRDIHTSLDKLVAEILKNTSLPRLRISSLEPWDISVDLLELFTNPRLMPHVHLPIQSGSDSVLRRMARRGCVADYQILIEKLRSIRSDISISSDIIVGFPGETEKDWQLTLETVQRLAFSQLHIFPFSPREGTVAATFSDRVPSPVVKSRCKTLDKLSQSLQTSFATQFISSCQNVLLEKINVDASATKTLQKISGLTPHFLKVEITHHNIPSSLMQEGAIQPGAIFPVCLERYDVVSQSLKGKIVM